MWFRRNLDTSARASFVVGSIQDIQDPVGVGYLRVLAPVSVRFFDPFVGPKTTNCGSKPTHVFACSKKVTFPCDLMFRAIILDPVHVGHGTTWHRFWLPRTRLGPLRYLNCWPFWPRNRSLQNLPGSMVCMAASFQKINKDNHVGAGGGGGVRVSKRFRCL